MGFVFRKRVLTGSSSWINLSRRGASASMRKGPVTMNSRGRFSVRVLPGVSYRGGCALTLLAPLAALGAAVGVVIGLG